jgi:hypothetical protein
MTQPTNAADTVLRMALDWCRRCGGGRLAAVVAHQYEEVTLELQEVAP